MAKSVRFSSCEDLGVRAGSKRWQTLRDTGIGASEIAGALGRVD